VFVRVCCRHVLSETLSKVCIGMYNVPLNTGMGCVCASLSLSLSLSLEEKSLEDDKNIDEMKVTNTTQHTSFEKENVTYKQRPYAIRTDDDPKTKIKNTALTTTFYNKIK
jgi:hypothetical protein